MSMRLFFFSTLFACFIISLVRADQSVDNGQEDDGVTINNRMRNSNINMDSHSDSIVRRENEGPDPKLVGCVDACTARFRNQRPVPNVNEFTLCKAQCFSVFSKPN